MFNPCFSNTILFDVIFYFYLFWHCGQHTLSKCKLKVKIDVWAYNEFLLLFFILWYWKINYKCIFLPYSRHIHDIVHGELSEASRWTRIKTRKFCSSLFSNSCHNRRNKCLNILYSMQIFKYYTIAWKSLFIMHRKHYGYYNQLIGVMIMSPNSLALL